MIDTTGNIAEEKALGVFGVSGHGSFDLVALPLEYKMGQGSSHSLYIAPAVMI